MKSTIGIVVAVVLLGGLACRQPAGTPQKIPVTTSSVEARDAFLKGRDLVGKLRTVEARPLLQEAIGKDPNFALAHLLLAQTALAPREFFEHLKAAVAAAGKASEGEQLWIRGVEAGANGNTQERGGSYKKLVAAYPDDELAHQLLGMHYNAIQQYDDAIAEYQKAIQLAPGFASAQNQLGYALREAGKDKEAEAAFRRYIELIPNEPNPYDSLAELLMKMGRFDESIEAYQKALSINAQFTNAYRGIAADLMYQGKHKEAQEQLQKAYNLARTDGERRQMLFAMAVCFTDQGKLSAAIEKINQISTLAQQQGDNALMAGNANTRGDLFLNAGKIREAQTEYSKALELGRQSVVPDRVKKNFELGNHGSLALVACAKKDFNAAKKEAEIMRAGVEPRGNPNQMRGVQEVLGIIALNEKNYDEAISRLTQANIHSPYVMFHLGKAYTGKKDKENAKAWYEKAANANTLPDINYAMVRQQAKKALGK